jgi:two-component system chemotaxis response regulator CheY
MKALIVEDDFTSRGLIEMMFKKIGGVQIAVKRGDGGVGIKCASDAGEPYDVMCLDIMIPELDGHEVLRVIRMLEARSGVPESSGIKIIVTTAQRDVENVKKAIQGKCDGYLLKPIDKPGLLDKLRTLKVIA